MRLASVSDGRDEQEQPPAWPRRYKTHTLRGHHENTKKPQVMPLLRQILTHATDKSHQLLRAKALECISLVGMAIGRDRFRDDAHSVLQYMQTLQVR